MDTYHIWCDLKPGTRDIAFAQAVSAYLGRLREAKLLESFRLTRRKLGLAPPDLGEFHIAIDVRDLAQLERTFSEVAARDGETERLHAQVYSVVQNARFALYRDFPDAVRVDNLDGHSGRG